MRIKNIYINNVEVTFELQREGYNNKKGDKLCVSLKVELF